MPEQIERTDYLYRGRVLNLRRDRVILPDGQMASREVVEHVDSVGILALDENENLLLVDQYRHPAGKVLLEIPAGCLEPGENPQETAIRELREETGYTASKIEKLGGFYLAPGYSIEYMHIFLVSQLSYMPLTAEDTDEIELVRQPLGSVLESIRSGRIVDCKSIAAILMMVDRRKSSTQFTG